MMEPTHAILENEHTDGKNVMSGILEDVPGPALSWMPEVISVLTTILLVLGAIALLLLIIYLIRRV